jgi:hypothetical protein
VPVWLALAVLACYLNAFSGAFQFDDYHVIVNNPLVHSWGAWQSGLGHGIRPLLKFSYTLDWTLGLGVTGFHLTNLLIHLGNAYLVYRLAGEFVSRQLQAGRMRHAPLLAALLFIAHPAQTEAVTYICGRSSSLMTLFYLGALLAYVIGRTRHSRIYLYVLTPLLFILALGVKETAVTFPLALLAWELCCGGSWKTALKAQWPNWAVLLLGAVFFLFNDSYYAEMAGSSALNSLPGNAATQLSGYAWLLRQWALPLWLNIDPDLPLLHDFSGAVLPLAVFLATVVLILACWRKRPWIAFALAWAIVHLLPLYLLLPRLDVANERQLYLAGWPLLLALAVELSLLLRTRAFRPVAAVLLIAFATLTVVRNQDYASEIALWEDTVKKSPGKVRAHNNLGFAYLLAERNAEARREFTIALQLDPKSARARYNLESLEPERHPI